MKQENFDYLKTQVMLAGFDGSVVDEMKQKMEQNSPSFPLSYKQQFGKDEVETTLHFRKSDTNENYYFNKWDAVLKHPGDENSTRQKPEVKQTFYTGRDNNYSLTEAYNLLSGRFVNKDLVSSKGEQFNAWTKLDFKDADTTGNFKFKYYGDKWGFDLDKALSKFPLIKELATEADKTKLTDSLKRGNLQEVTLLRNGKEEKGFVETNAFARSVMVYDGDMKRIKLSEAKEAVSQSNDQSVGKDVKQDNKQTNGENNNEGAAQKNDQKREQNNRRSQGIRA